MQSDTYSFLLRLDSQSRDQFFDRRNFRRKTRGEFFGRPADDLIPGTVRLLARFGRLRAAVVALDKTAMISGGVPAGANSALNVSETKPGKPDSIMVGTSGSENQRSAPVTASAVNLPSLISGSTGASATDPSSTVPSSTAMVAGPPPRYGMCTISMPARSLSCSAVRCDFVP